MERSHFEKQIARLRNQWPHSYGLERTARIWQMCQKMNDSRFTEIIDLALDSERNAPLAADLCKLENEVIKRDSRLRYQSQASVGSVLSTAQKTTGADKEFVTQCLNLLRSKLSGKMNSKNFYEGCEMLDTAARLYTKPKPPASPTYKPSPRPDLEKI